MATIASNVRVAVSGAVYNGVTAAPTGTASAPAGGTDLGGLSEDGVDVTVPTSGDSTPIKQMDGTTVRTIRKPPSDSPTWQMTFIESSQAVVEMAFGVTITPGASDGSFTYKAQNRAHDAYVVDYIDGAVLTRDYIPYGIVTDLAGQKMGNSDAVKYTVTITGELDPVVDYNFMRFSTDWRTVAAWVTATAYSLADRVTVAGGTLEAIVAGTSGATEPTAPATVGGTVVDGTVTWKRIA